MEYLIGFGGVFAFVFFAVWIDDWATARFAKHYEPPAQPTHVRVIKETA